MQYSITGGITLAWEGALCAGVSYYDGSMHLIADYTKEDFSFHAEVTLKVGANITAEVTIPCVMTGSIWAGVGIKCTATATPYTDGQKPTLCLTTKAYLYAEVGAAVSYHIGLSSNKYRKTYEIWSETTSPVRTVSHYEDGVTVSTCTRGEDLTYVTSPASKYYNYARTNSSGSYSYTDGSGSTVVVVTWEYTLDDEDNATITAYNGNASAVAIPTKIDGYTVTAIGDSAFQGNTRIRSVSIPNTVLTIGSWAFQNCTKLSSVTLSKNLTTLGMYAFGACTSLTEIEIPKSLTTVDGWGDN
ncbi:MAG: leucine-rich repeat domain-containing protein, partial [Clostridia bacterium]|nr:leucine-rich repeat domain-containing protein [Clostridia bacterium]